MEILTLHSNLNSPIFTAVIYHYIKICFAIYVFMHPTVCLRNNSKNQFLHKIPDTFLFSYTPCVVSVFYYNDFSDKNNKITEESERLINLSVTHNMFSWDLRNLLAQSVSFHRFIL